MVCAQGAHYTIFCLEHPPNDNNSCVLDITNYPPPIQIEVAGQPWTYLSCPDPRRFKQGESGSHLTAHNDAIVLAIDGTCRDPASPGARAAVGIFVHRDSELNVGRIVHEPDVRTTLQRAQLLAVLAALDLVKWVRSRNDLPDQPDGPLRRLRRVVLKTDARYVIKGSANWFPEELSNGCVLCPGYITALWVDKLAVTHVRGRAFV